MSVINYGIEVITEKTAITNQAYGLVDGIFRWITGRPSYDGSTVIPKDEFGNDITTAWYEGIITKDSIRGLSRAVDISETGDYGVGSSLSFGIRNDQLIWEFVYLNKIYFINRTVNVYVIIDNVFYQVWSGIVTKNPTEEDSYMFNCSDAYKTLHKMMPPIVVSNTNFPGSSEDAQGAVIPICVGDVTYAKLQTISDASETYNIVDTTLLSDKRYLIKACYAVNYYHQGPFIAHPYITLYTKGVTFTLNQLAGSYLFPVAGGGECSSDQLVRVYGNAATVNDRTVVYLEDGLESVSQDLFNKKYAYDPQNNIPYESYAGDFFTPLLSCNVDTQRHTIYGLDGSGIAQSMWFYGTLNLYNNGAGTNVLRFKYYYARAARIMVFSDPQLQNQIGEGILDNPTLYTGKWVDVEVFLDKVYYEATKTLYFVVGSTNNGRSYNNVQISSISTIHSVPDADTWSFSILTMPVSRIISTKGIKDYQKDATGRPILYTYNEATSQMEIAPNVLIDSFKGTSTDFPSFTVVPTRINSSGNAIYQTPIVPTEWEVIIPQSGYIQLPNNNLFRPRSMTSATKYKSEIDICDRNHDTSLQLVFPDASENVHNTYKFKIKLVFPQEYTAIPWDSLYAGVDLRVESLVVGRNIRVFGSFTSMSPYGEPLNEEDDDNTDGKYNDVDPVFYYPIDETPVSDVVEMYSLPYDYFNNGGKRDDVTSIWPLIAENANGEDTLFKSLIEIPTEIVTALKSGTTANMIQLNLYVTTTGADSSKTAPGDAFFVFIKEAGFVGVRSVSPTTDDIYVRVSGETLSDTSETNSVYGAFRLLLESYDGLNANQIDYTNLPQVRSNWRVGRQLIERQSSYNYLIELARQSFVGIYPTRLGKRGLKAWLDDYYTYTNTQRFYTVYFDGSNIGNSYLFSDHWNDSTDVTYESDTWGIGVKVPGSFPIADSVTGSLVPNSNAPLTVKGYISFWDLKTKVMVNPGVLTASTLSFDTDNTSQQNCCNSIKYEIVASNDYGSFVLATVDVNPTGYSIYMKNSTVTTGTFVNFDSIIVKLEKTTSEDQDVLDLNVAKGYGIIFGNEGQWSSTVRILFSNLTSNERQILGQTFTVSYRTTAKCNSTQAKLIYHQGTYISDGWYEWLPVNATPWSCPIVRGSITNWVETDITNLYNQFQIWYAFNEASGKYTRSISISNTDQSTFPAEDSAIWHDWVGGIAQSTYVDSKILWEALHYQYIISKTVNELPSSLANLSWYGNDNVFLGLPDKGASVNSGAYKYVRNAAYWLTRQKTQVTFSTPLTSDAIVKDLLSYVKFNDPIYTAGYDREGWITGIDIDTVNNLLKLTYTLKPLDDITDNLILEDGQLITKNQHNESGSTIDQVNDGQDR